MNNDRWHHLEPRPQSASTQLFLKGRRILASTVCFAMIDNGLTPEAVAIDMGVPVEAVLEAVEYVGLNMELIDSENAAVAESIPSRPE